MHYLQSSNQMKMNIDLRSGFTYVSSESIENDLNAVQTIESYANKYINTARNVGKSYLRRVSNMEDYSIDHPIMRLATNQLFFRQLQIIWWSPLIDSCSVFYSPPSKQTLRPTIKQRAYSLFRERYASSSKYQGSQLWHIDEDYPHTIKLWVYLTDVDENTGPFTVLPGPVSDEVVHFLGKYSSKKVNDAKLKKFMHHKISVQGKANTVFLVDTGRCYHHGSRNICSSKGRLAIVIHYTSIFSKYTLCKTD